MENSSDLLANRSRRVNVGCGAYYMQYVLNIDEDEHVPADIHCHVPPLPFDDNSMDAVWGCHFLEHLDFEEAQEFLAEAYRVLCPGGHLGLVVPDTREILRRYIEGAIDAVECPAGEWREVADLDNVCALFLYSTVQSSRHQWSYDQETLARAMAQAGFVNLWEIDRYRDPRIAQGAWYQFGLQGQKGEQNAK